MIHDLKSKPADFQPVATGRKTAELRLNDRTPAYAVGDVLRLREYIPDTERYTGQDCHVEVTCITDYPQALVPGYVMLSFRIVDRERVKAILRGAREATSPA